MPDKALDYLVKPFYAVTKTITFLFTICCQPRCKLFLCWPAKYIRAGVTKKMKYILLLFIVFTSSSVFAQNRQCPLVDCDCSALVVGEWRKDCRDQEKDLVKACVANKGKPTSYCRLQGLDAFPVALSVKPKQHDTLDRAGIRAAEKQIESLNWSARQDLQMTAELEQRQEYAAALGLYKGREKSLAKAHRLRQQIAQSHAALKDEEAAIDFWRDVTKASRSNGLNEELGEIEALWSAWQSQQLSGEQKRGIQLLALRKLRNLGNDTERLADAYSRSRQIERAAQHWQRAADMAEQLSGWMKQVKGKPTHIRYFRNQAAARWHKAALFWVQTQTGADGPATFARSEAERIISGTSQKAVADL